MTTRDSQTPTQGDTTGTEPKIPQELPASDPRRNEVPDTPPRAGRRRKKTKRGLILIVLAVAGPATAEDWSIERFQWSGSTQRIVALEIVNPHGDVRTRSSGINEIEVLANIQNAPGDPYEAVVRIADETVPFRIEVEWKLREGADTGESKSGMEKRRVDLTVIVPRMSPLMVRTAAGLIEAKGHGAAVAAESESGEIRIKTEGTVSARSNRGAIDAVLGTIDQKTFSTFETTTGDITVWLPAGAAVTVEAQTEGVISTDYSIDIRRAEGGSRKNATATIGGGGPQLKIQTIRGQVRLFRTLK